LISSIKYVLLSLHLCQNQMMRKSPCLWLTFWEETAKLWVILTCGEQMSLWNAYLLVSLLHQPFLVEKT
jgi:hypothetical protein